MRKLSLDEGRDLLPSRGIVTRLVVFIQLEDNFRTSFRYVYRGDVEMVTEQSTVPPPSDSYD